MKIQQISLFAENKPGHISAPARLLAQRTLVMQQGRVVEAGLTDQILDDPQHPYSQLLVSSILQA